MNIFFLSTDAIQAAQLQTRKSAIKQLLESAQMLSTAVRYHGYQGDDVYRSAYINHPSSIWARRNQTNFNWLCLHALALCERFEQESGKKHKSEAIIYRCAELASLLPESHSDTIVLSSFDLAMKSTEAGLQALAKFKASKGTLKDAVLAYKQYYSSKWYVKEAHQVGDKCLAWVDNLSEQRYTVSNHPVKKTIQKAQKIMNSIEVDIQQVQPIVRPVVSHKSMPIKKKCELYDTRVELESRAEIARKWARIERARRLAAKSRSK